MLEYIKTVNSVVVERFKIIQFAVDCEKETLIVTLRHVYYDESNNLCDAIVSHSINNKAATEIDPSFEFTTEGIASLFGGTIPESISINNLSSWDIILAAAPKIVTASKKYYTNIMSNLTLNLFQAIYSHLVTMTVLPSGIEWSIANEI